MPRISEFYGIYIYMYFQDHSPAHIHAIYGEYEILVAIETKEILRGNLPRRAERMVLEWVELHYAELLEDWKRARTGLPIKPIAPLE